MDIVVCMKQVLDTRLPLEVTPQGEVAQKEPSPIFVADPSDRCALEEAMRIREGVGNCRVTVITLGPLGAERLLADCLARGADQAVHLKVNDSVTVDSFVTARLLGAEIKRLGFDLVLCGDSALDDGPSETGPVLAEILDVAQVTGVARLEVSPDACRISAERKLERGYRQIVEVDLPAVVTVDGFICQPRYVSSRAKRYAAKTMVNSCQVVQIEDPTILDGSALRKVLRLSPPRPRVKNIALPDATLSAEDRLALIMGGSTPTKSGGTVSSGPEAAADEIITFLKEMGVVP